MVWDHRDRVTACRSRVTTPAGTRGTRKVRPTRRRPRCCIPPENVGASANADGVGPEGGQHSASAGISLGDLPCAVTSTCPPSRPAKADHRRDMERANDISRAAEHFHTKV
jgi:hypothetical protein